MLLLKVMQCNLKLHGFSLGSFLHRYRHPNIMDFVGYSIEGQTYCLIYVYMPKGSLEDRLLCKVSYHSCLTIWALHQCLVCYSKNSSLRMKPVIICSPSCCSKCAWLYSKRGTLREGPVCSVYINWKWMGTELLSPKYFVWLIFCVLKLYDRIKFKYFFSLNGSFVQPGFQISFESLHVPL